MPLKRSGRWAWRNSSQASPSSAAESWRELRAPTESARRMRRKRMKMAKTARPRMRPPLPFSKEKAESRPLTTSVPVTIARAIPAAAAGARRRCAACGGGRPRRRPAAARSARPTPRSAVSSAGNMPAVGTICGLRIGPRRPRSRASAASGKTSVIRISLRRGAARVAAPTTVTSTIGVARAARLPPAAADPEQHEAGDPEQHQRDLDDPAGVVAMASPTPLDHIRPTLRTVIPR